MKHISQSIQKLLEKMKQEQKSKFYEHNRDIFLRYFDSLEQYQALICAGNFKKLEGIIKDNSNFSFEEFAETIKRP